jgi:hypothetical protein
MRTRKTASLAMLTVTPVITLAMTAPADAASRWMYKSSEHIASAQWIEYGALNGVDGNVHVGYLQAQTSASGGNVWGEVVDYQCDEGEVPGGGGHGGPGEFSGDYFDEEPEPTCDVMSFRWIEGNDVNFTVAKKLNTARLTGTLYVDNHGAGATPPVDMTWTGTGDLSHTTWYEKGTEGGSRYVYKYESTYRQADVTGFIGAMGFTDDADDQSSGSIQKTKTSERGSSR